MIRVYGMYFASRTKYCDSALIDNVIMQDPVLAPKIHCVTNQITTASFRVFVLDSAIAKK